MPRSSRRVRLAVAAAAAGLLSVAGAAPASAHSLESSTLSVHVGEQSADVTLSVALEAVDQALGTDHAATGDVAAYGDELVDYLDAHLSVTGADGTAWPETWADPVVEQVEGITSFSVDVALDPAGADPSAFTLTYDAVLEAVPAHEAVVVLTDAAGNVSTAGVLTASDETLTLGGTGGTGITDMVGHGFSHVLAGADHLLFLVTLLLVAPLVVVAGRWTRRDDALGTARKVLELTTAFTVGHSVTLLAAALGWVSLPSGPVEVLIAASVAVSALHAARPLVRRGEEAIAIGFGLVHGLAFAGILTDLGLDGSTSLPALLAFNAGVELAQLATIALLFPSLYLASRTRWYPALRVTTATGAGLAACAWALDRTGLLADPFLAAEEALVSHAWQVVLALAALATLCRLTDRRSDERSKGAGLAGVSYRASAHGLVPGPTR